MSSSSGLSGALASSSAVGPSSFSEDSGVGFSLGSGVACGSGFGVACSSDSDVACGSDSGTLFGSTSFILSSHVVTPSADAFSLGTAVVVSEVAKSSFGGGTSSWAEAMSAAETRDRRNVGRQLVPELIDSCGRLSVLVVGSLAGMGMFMGVCKSIKNYH